MAETLNLFRCAYSDQVLVETLALYYIYRVVKGCYFVPRTPLPWPPDPMRPTTTALVVVVVAAAAAAVYCSLVTVMRSSMRKIVMAASVAKRNALILLTAGSTTPAAKLSRISP